MFFFVLNKWDESLYSYIVVNRILYYLLKHEFRFLICSPPNGNTELEIENFYSQYS